MHRFRATARRRADLRCRSYGHEHPSRAFLLIEVAPTSLEHDRTTKGGLYAEAGVPEYWIVNLADRQLEIYDSPASGRYQRTRIVPPGENASPAAFPDLAVAVASILP